MNLQVNHGNSKRDRGLTKMNLEFMSNSKMLSSSQENQSSSLLSTRLNNKPDDFLSIMHHPQDKNEPLQTVHDHILLVNLIRKVSPLLENRYRLIHIPVVAAY